jgi:hypothetical protein
MGYCCVRVLRPWLMFASAIVASPSSSALAQDHLEPERRSLNEALPLLEYKLGLHKALLKGAATHYRARIICEPAFRRRWVLTLVCEEEEGAPPVYFVEYAGLAGPTDGRPGGQKARVSLDREAAEAIQNVWLRMLRAVRYPDTPRSGADGVNYYFSRFVSLIEADPRWHFVGGRSGPQTANSRGA